MQLISEAPNWTAVFATLSTEQLLPVMMLANEYGYDCHPFEWLKKALKGQSSAGGDRHPMCTEHILVVYKRAAGSIARAFGEHFALRKRKRTMEIAEQVRFSFGGFTRRARRQNWIEY